MDAPMRQHEYQLKTFVHRVLALRLLVAGLIVAVAFGAIGFADTARQV